MATVLNRSSDVGDPPSNIEAGTSPVGIGGVLSSAPSLTIFPDIQTTYASTYALVGAQEPQRLDLVLPTHIDHDGAVVSAASVRVRALGGVLSESEMIAVLRAAGWPTELIPQALAVSYCESKWSPYALGDSGRSAGLFQVNRGTWFPYAGEDGELWADPVVNARVALRVYYYDIARGQRPWQQWTCKP